MSRNKISRFGAASCWQWLQQEGPRHPKHATWTHPVAVCLIHYTLVAAITVTAHDFAAMIYFHGWRAWGSQNGDNFTLHSMSNCTDSLSPNLRERRRRVAFWFIMYSMWILFWRMLQRKDPNLDSTTCKAPVIGTGSTPAPMPSLTKPFLKHRQYRNTGNYLNNNCLVLYEFCWLCNVTLVMSAWAFVTGRPVLACAYAITVGIDQLLWYVDVIGFVCTGKFVVGVAKYLTWPGQSGWTSRITCTHHFWTIPAILYAFGAESRPRLHALSLPLSFVCMATNVVLSRWLIPSHVEFLINDDDGKVLSIAHKYLNVNLSHELWKDITFDFLQINHGNPPVALYLFRLLWRWQGFNVLVFVFLYGVCRLLDSTDSSIGAALPC